MLAVFACIGGARADGLDACMQNGAAAIALAFVRTGATFPRVGFDGRTFPLPDALGGGEIFLHHAFPPTGGCALAIDVDLRFAVAPDAAALRLFGEAAGGALNAPPANILAMAAACRASLPAQFDGHNGKEGLRQHRLGITLECDDQYWSMGRMEAGFTAYAQTDDAYYLPPLKTSDPNCLLDPARRLALWAHLNPAMAIRRPDVVNDAVLFTLAAVADLPEIEFAAACGGAVEVTFGARRPSSPALALAREGVTAALGRPISADEWSAVMHCLDTLPKTFDVAGHAIGEAAETSTRLVVCDAEKDADSGDVQATVALKPR